eukprot:1142436-Pelagomonas_calceolata.AAC.2
MSHDDILELVNGVFGYGNQLEWSSVESVLLHIHRVFPGYRGEAGGPHNNEEFVDALLDFRGEQPKDLNYYAIWTWGLEKQYRVQVQIYYYGMMILFPGIITRCSFWKIFAMLIVKCLHSFLQFLSAIWACLVASVSLLPVSGSHSAWSPCVLVWGLQ